MKLNQLNEVVDWNEKSEKQQIAMVKSGAFNAIAHIKNPSEAVQLVAVSVNGFAIRFIILRGITPSSAVQHAAVTQTPRAIEYIDNPTPTAIKTALTSINFIYEEEAYSGEVRRLFANNAILMKKWLRYGETMRNQT
jgi:hypothetical protein